MSKDVEIKVLSFNKKYPKINLKLKESDFKLYKLALLAAYISELKEGYRVDKQYKTNSKGTQFKYVPLTSLEDAKEYKSILDIMLEEIKSL